MKTEHATSFAIFCFVSLMAVTLSSEKSLAIGKKSSKDLPPVEELAVREGMPDPFVNPDGSRISSTKEWPAQRTYLKAMLAHYQYGAMPPRPKQFDLKRIWRKPVSGEKAIHERYAVTLIRNQKSTTFHFELIRPAEGKRVPLIVKNCYTFFEGEDKARLTAEHDKAAAMQAVSRGYLLCKFNRNEIAADGRDNRDTGVFPLYPEYDWGTIAAWAWAHGLVADALDRLGLVDMKKIVATGHSRGGKTALCAGIYDERIAITAPNSSGTGGTGSLRYFEAGQKPQRLILHKKTFPHWWVSRFFDFGGKEDRLPFDSHTAKALIAPRALINAHARQDYWANPYGTELTYRAADKVFKWLGAEKQQGIHWRDGKHAQNEEDWQALLDFADWKFFNKKSERSFSKLAYPDAKLPIKWNVPDMGKNLDNEAQPSTVIPVPSRLKKFMPRLHQEKLKEATNAKIDFVMIGDSITHSWGKYPGAFEGSNLLNLGFPGDRTQNVLWRIRNGALDGISPKLVTLMIGTNNLHEDKKAYPPDQPEDIFAGIKAIVVEARARLPESKIVIFSIFPRKEGPAYERVKAVNAMLPQLADGKRVSHLDLNRFFSTEKGQQNKALYKSDLLHHNEQGYLAWAKALKPLLEKHGLRLNLNALPKSANNPLPTAKDNNPNIIYFMLDEWGYFESSVMGHPILETPNIDKVASEGIRFTQFLAGANVCAPTRSTLITGQHAGHTTVRGPGCLRADEVTIGSMLKDAGYATGGFGKWGLGDVGTTGVPEKHGFDVFFGYYNQTHAHTFYPRYLIRNSKKVRLAGNAGDFHKGKTFSHSLIFEDSLDFIRENKDRPFFAYLPWTPPHGFWAMPDNEPAWQKYKDKKWDATNQKGTHDAQMYAAMVEMVDRQIGEIMDLLKKLRIDDDTIVFISGDNGGKTYFKSNEHPHGFLAPNLNPKTGERFRGGKGDFYEGGIRVPFIVRWPGKIKAGTISDHLGYFPDIMPTLAKIAHARPRKDTDGISILPTLLGGKNAGRQQNQHKYLYWENKKSIALRMNDWKAIRPNKNLPFELYDLSKDIEELNDVADQFPDIIEKMTAYAKNAHTPVTLGQVLDASLGFKGHKED